MRLPSSFVILAAISTFSAVIEAEIPPLSDFGVYPNPLNLTAADRQHFHPVVLFPTIKDDDESNIPNIQVLDFTKPTSQRHLATEEERKGPLPTAAIQPFAVGRYDEDRVNMYESDLFQHEKRTIHMGIDLAGPVGTPVYSFAAGTILHVGYNPALGDYGNVMVIQHPHINTMIYALYGHLSDASIEGRAAGDAVVHGAVLGSIGAVHENGGWFQPHVHFQLSIEPPETHDMPGAVAKKDRDRALLQYPDPRYVLGPLY